ncbi:MAG: zinc-ribbon domain containing protein [Candidatus Gastranaerophilales bacterium]
MYQDEKLICEDCGAEFIFTVGEQEFYAEKGLVNKPKRCNDCRKNRRQGGGGRGKQQRRMYDAVCSKCGVQTQVPFKPVNGKDVYCRDCFTNQ